jgi:predicted O-methyltransferase YrrM
VPTSGAPLNTNVRWMVTVRENALMSDFKQREAVNAHLLEFYGGDPFDALIHEAEGHHAFHGPECGLFPAGPHVMRFVATLVRASQAKHILDIGTGFGYSALWLAEAAGSGARVETIDRFQEHLSVARRFAEQAGLSERMGFIPGEAAEVLRHLTGPYDLVHDDGWFAYQPTYFERVVELLKPGGLLTMPNWFLLEDALSGTPRRDWSEFAGKAWAEATLTYARHLAQDSRFYVTWSISPPLGVAVKQGTPGLAVEVLR